MISTKIHFRFDVQHTSIEKQSFFKFITSPANSKLILVAAIAALIQFSLFKLFYPFPDFFGDSTSYIYAASANLNINIWPIGYSKFLTAFHWLTYSDTALVGFQYFFLELSALYFFFTNLYLFTPQRRTANILFAFLFFNPLTLYLSNYINSDPLFAAVSLIWVAELLWIIYTPTSIRLLTQAILLLICFSIRNNAYYYPLLSGIAYYLSSHRLWKKVVGTALGITLVAAFIIVERKAAFEVTGTRQYSLFTGWQLANNALYIYDKIDVDRSKLPDAQTKELDSLSKQYFKSVSKSLNHKKYSSYDEYLRFYVGNYFIRQPESPLKQYLWARYDVSEDSNKISAWGKSSPVFAAYGTWIISHYPIKYLLYFILPNVRNYFLPPLEKLEIYNLGLDNVSFEAQNWFDYKTPFVWAVSRKIQGVILFIFPPLFFVLNLFFLGYTVWLFTKKGEMKKIAGRRSVILFSLCFWLLNFCFSIVATINVFRYQFFPMIIVLSYSLLLGELLHQKEAIGNKLPHISTGLALEGRLSAR
jgi:hypothetical protein